jgi:hypothetical protein
MASFWRAAYAFYAIVLCSLVGCNANMSYGSADADATTHAEKLVRDVGANWDTGTFDKDVMPGFYDSMKHQDIEKLLGIFRRKLGPIRLLKLQNSAERSTAGTNGAFTEAQFRYNATFKKGPGQIVVIVINHGQGWSIENFQVNSDALLE